MWLRDALPLDIPNARILIYGYDTQLVRSSSFQNLSDLGRALQIDLRGIQVCILRLKSESLYVANLAYRTQSIPIP